jgi:hypothetical protein
MQRPPSGPERKLPLSVFASSLPSFACSLIFGMQLHTGLPKGQLFRYAASIRILNLKRPGA